MAQPLMSHVGYDLVLTEAYKYLSGIPCTVVRFCLFNLLNSLFASNSKINQWSNTIGTLRAQQLTNDRTTVRDLVLSLSKS